MWPILHDEDVIYFRKVNFSKIIINDIICFKDKKHLVTHRVIYKSKNFVITKGDNNPVSDGKIKKERILGRIYSVKRGEKKFNIDDPYLFQSSIYFEEIKRVAGLFSRAGINYVILKGLPLHLLLDKKHPRRIYADCDIIIEKKDILRAKKVFRNEGYRRVDVSLSKRHKRIKDKISEESFVKNISNYPIIFDIHSEAAFMMTQLGKLEYLYPQKLLDNFSQSLINNRRIVEIEGTKFPLLSREDQIIYLFLHLFHHNFRGAYRYDILVKLLAKKFDEVALINTINKYKLNNFVYAGLMLLQKYYPNKKYKEMSELMGVLEGIKRFVGQEILTTKIFDDEERIGGGVRRFLLLFYLSPRPIFIRLFTVFNKQVIYSIWWVFLNKIRLIYLPTILLWRALSKAKS